MTDFQGTQFSLPEQRPFKGQEPPKAAIHPEVSKKCDEFIQDKLKVITDSPFSAEEKVALEALLRKSVVKLMDMELPEVEKGLNKLDQQITGYRKVNFYITARIKSIGKLDLTEDEKKLMSQKLIEGGAVILKDIQEGYLNSLKEINKKIVAIDQFVLSPESEEQPIPQSPKTETVELQKLTQVKMYDHQLDPKAEKLTNLHASTALSFVRRLSMKQESKLFLSKLIQDQVVNLRQQYRQNRIDLKGYEAALKEIKANLTPLTKEIGELEEQEKLLKTAIKGIAVSHYVRDTLDQYIHRNLHEIKRQDYPTKESVGKLLEAVHNEYMAALRVAEFISTREPSFDVFEKDLFEIIESPVLDSETKSELYDMYDAGIQALIGYIARGEGDDIALDGYLLDLKAQIFQTIDSRLKDT